MYPSFIRAALNKKLALWHKRFSIYGKVACKKKQALICNKLIRKHHAAIE